MHLLCWFHLLQHRCVCPAVATCCSTTRSTMLLPLAAAPLYLLCCSHLPQHHCSFSDVSTCCSTIGSTLLLPLDARAPLHLHPWCFHLLQRRCVISSNSTCYSVIVLSLLHPPAAAPCTAFPLLLCVFKHVYTVQLYSST